MLELFPIPNALQGKTHISVDSYQELYQLSVTDPQGFWAKQGRDCLQWLTPFERVMDYDIANAKFSWFAGGQLNVSANCIDRHLANNSESIAIIWEGNEPGEERKLTYAELHEQVCRFANVLKKHNIKKGDRVAIYMPMVPELPIAMLACARIGAIHSVIFAGFSAESIRDRVADCQCSMLITANQAVRGTKLIELKQIVDRGIAGLDYLKSVIVVQRTPEPCAMQPERDFDWHSEVASVSAECSAEPMDAEDPLFVLYTSGSTGKPKGVLHSSAGYLLYASITHKYVFDYRPGDVYFCAADIGWITGHSYIVYGPLANGATTILFESIPTYPDAGRYWSIVEKHRVNIFYTAPTAIRTILKEGDQYVSKYDRSSLRVLGSVGEPINRDAWLWYHQVVGAGNTAVVDTWWQTETGGIMISALPGAIETKPGSATLPFFGIQPCLVDEQGKEIAETIAKGRLCIKHPWPGQMRTVYGDHQRFIDTYFTQVPGMYFTGDAANRDADGYYWISGRVDDVLNVAGHRLGTAEIESALVSSGIVAEAAVVGFPHDIKGNGVYAYCILRDDAKLSDSLVRVKQAVRDSIGAFATPDIIQFVGGLPKTRSGKIMRRILRKIASNDFENLGDISTLADPAVVESIIQGHKDLNIT